MKMQNNIPGTTIPYDKEKKGMFSVFIPLIKATNGLTLGQVCAVTGLEPSTVQNWVRRKFVSNPVSKKYYERQLARILLISALRDCMKIENIGELMSMINGNANDESDDIIAEENLYDYFCSAVSKVNDIKILSEKRDKEISDMIDDVILDYDSPSDKARQCLKEALEVMVYAYVSGKLKNMVYMKFGKMKDSENNNVS